MRVTRAAALFHTKRAWLFSLLLLFCLLVSSLAVAAITVQATPPTANITPDLNNAIHITYTAQDTLAARAGGAATFSAVSSQGELRTEDGAVLATVGNSVAVTGVNYRGMSNETLVVPVRVVTAALNAGKSSIIYRRTFEILSRDAISQVTVEVGLWITPASAGQFSLVRMDLEFHDTQDSAAGRPTSGGRITVPRNSVGLGAAARLSYRGRGTLRGQWKVDGQILGMVTLTLPPGQEEIALTSPVTPGFPTFAGGLHKVEFEVLDPLPAFSQPAIYYFVGEEERLPAAGSLRLVQPLENDHITYGPGRLPRFIWESSGEDVHYLFRLWRQDTGTKPADTITGAKLGESGLVTAAATRQPAFTLTAFDAATIQPGVTYVWQVRAYRGTELVSISRERMVYFAAGRRDGEEKP